METTDQIGFYLTVFDNTTVKYERRVYNIVMLFSSSHSRLVAGGVALPPTHSGDAKENYGMAAWWPNSK